MQRIILALIIVVLLGMTSGIEFGSAESGTQEKPVIYVFNESITFQSVFRSDIPVELAVIFFQDQNETQTFVELASIKRLGQEVYEIQHTHPASRHRFQAFTTIEYRFELLLEGGDTYKSPSYEFLYADNRFDWESLQEGPFIVYWFDGDYAFAQSILDVAQEGLSNITDILPLPEPELLHIYVYPDASLMRDALNPNREEWIAGHAYPDRQTMILYLTPSAENVLDMRQRVPHETMHILLYQMTGSGYKNLPFWLVEGLASMVELYPNPDYAILLDNALAKNELIPMGSLCESFPRDASGALLAYAQSASFTSFLYASYGTQGLQRVIAEYANGLNCENGIRSALGSEFQQLERRWRREYLSGNPAISALLRILPWLLILAMVFIAPVGYMLATYRWSKRKTKQEQPVRQDTAIESGGDRP